MDLNTVERLTDGIFSKALQVRRMLQRGAASRWAGACSCHPDAADLTGLVLAEIAALGKQVESLLPPEQLAEGAAAVAGQRWHRPTVEMSVAEGYAEWAEQYDGEAGANPLIALEEPVTLELIGEVADLNVLDAACGTGRYALRLAEAGARVCGVDASEEMLAHARRRAAEYGLSIDLKLGELSALPFEDARFDLVVSALAFCHLPDLQPAVSEMARVLRPGGRVGYLGLPSVLSTDRLAHRVRPAGGRAIGSRTT